MSWRGHRQWAPVGVFLFPPFDGFLPWFLHKVAEGVLSVTTSHPPCVFLPPSWRSLTSRSFFLTGDGHRAGVFAELGRTLDLLRKPQLMHSPSGSRGAQFILPWKFQFVHGGFHRPSGCALLSFVPLTSGASPSSLVPTDLIIVRHQHVPPPAHSVTLKTVHQH